MLTPQALERASEQYRLGYRDGNSGSVQKITVDTGTFNAHDYVEGYRAGANDAIWESGYRKGKVLASAWPKIQ